MAAVELTSRAQRLAQAARQLESAPTLAGARRLTITGGGTTRAGPALTPAEPRLSDAYRRPTFRNRRQAAVGDAA
jgi:hypothetical protein